MVKMDKLELKKMLKPLMKECIREVLMEQGIMSLVSETKQTNTIKKEETVVNKQEVEQKPQINEARKAMLESIGKAGYLNNKFDPFSNTKPLTETQAANAAPQKGLLEGMDLSDPGVDISSFMNNTNKWKALAGGKGK